MRFIIIVAVVMFLSLAAASSTEQLVASEEAMFWVNGSWVPAEQLQVGDKFMTPDGKVAVVKSVVIIKV